ncbi:MAG: L,D-transpeptidase [Alphaproteobacteria bacterium]|nr:L,D-transpeptidase [Alphaproteobacteria bacterium]
MRSFLNLLAIFVLAAAAFVSAPVETAEAGVTVKISRSSQTMRVYVGGKLRHRWRVSTGRRGYTTPSGSYRPQRLERMWHSRKYHWSPMPHSIFFRGGYAIHGTNETGRLGRRASHGCVRLSRGNARRLFGLVRKYGRGGTRIYIH